MEFSVDGDGLRLVVKWREIRVLIRSVQALIIAVGALFSAPSIMKVGELLGLW
jgi:hypothetical protein